MKEDKIIQIAYSPNDEVIVGLSENGNIYTICLANSLDWQKVAQSPKLKKFNK